MILIDFGGLSISSVFALRTPKVEEGMLRHLILSQLQMLNAKYRNKYGEMVICCEGGSWRKNVFAEYKAGRSETREASPIDWDSVWSAINNITEEIKEFLPYRVVRVKGAEADDVLAILTESTQEFGNNENVLLASSDKDLLQLQKYSNVQQYSFATKKLIVEKKPRELLLEHIFRGDGADGIPNVLSPDDCFTAGKRQTPLKAAKIKHWIENYKRLDEIMTDEEYRNFVRNRRCIDLSYIPEEITQAVLDEFRRQPLTPNSKVLNYLITKRCRNLIPGVQNFFRLDK